MKLSTADWERLHAAVLFFAFAFLFLFFFLTFGLTANLAYQAVAGSRFSEQTATIVISVLAGVPATGLATILILFKFHDASLDFVGLGFDPGWLREVAAGFVLGLIMMFGVVVLELITGHLRFHWAGVSPLRWMAQLWAFLPLFLLGAVHEELLFRGYPFQRLIDAVGAPAAVLLLSALFGVVHYENPYASNIGAFNTLLIGIAFALAYLRTRRLWFPIGLHWGWNYFEFAFGLPVSGIKIEKTPLSAEVAGNVWFHGGGYGPEASLIGTLVFVLAIVALWRWEGVPSPLAPGETDTGPSSEAL